MADCFRYQTNATGFFHPLKINDRWWLIDPLGYRFLHQGIAAVATINSTGAIAALTAKFTNSSNWAVATTALLHSNRFNGAGAWSDTTRLPQVSGPLVYTIIKNFLSTYSATQHQLRLSAGIRPHLRAVLPDLRAVLCQHQELTLICWAISPTTS